MHLFARFAMAAAALALSMAAAAPRPAAAIGVPVTRAQASCAGKWGLTEACPLPLRFAAGTYGAITHGRITPASYHRFYSFRARAGQRMILTFAGAGAMRAGLQYPSAGGDGPFDGTGGLITLPQTGTYIISVGANPMAGEPWSGRFTLSLLIK